MIFVFFSLSEYIATLSLKFFCKLQKVSMRGVGSESLLPLSPEAKTGDATRMSHRLKLGRGVTAMSARCRTPCSFHDNKRLPVSLSCDMTGD